MDGYIKKKTLINRLGTLISEGKISPNTARFVLGLPPMGESVAPDNPALTYKNCIDLITREISSLDIKLVNMKTLDHKEKPRVLIKPNPYQTIGQFIEAWARSLLTTGNTYVLRETDNRGSLKHLHILDSKNVVVLTATDGSIWYEVGPDNIAGLNENIRLPASEIIHDRINADFHILVGLSPVYSGHTAIIPNEANYLRNSSDIEIINALSWSSEIVCSVFNVPPYKLGIGQYPRDKDVLRQEETRYQSGIIGTINQNICYHLERLFDDADGTFVYFDNASPKVL